MQEPSRAGALGPDRVMVDGSWLMAMAEDTRPSTIAISHQPLAMASVRDQAMASVRALMWQHAGLFRTREGLTAAVESLDHASVPASPATAEEWQYRNLVTVGRLIAGAALRREESRGGHFRADFPERDDARWKVHLVDAGGTT
jgi:aspartate oxidase